MKIRKMVGVVSASVMTMMLVGVVYAGRKDASAKRAQAKQEILARSGYCWREKKEKDSIISEVVKLPVSQELPAKTDLGKFVLGPLSEEHKGEPTVVTEVVIPAGYASIGEKAFCGCSELTGITIPEKVSSIGHYAFMFCKKLTEIKLPENLESIGNGAFSSSGLTSIAIPGSVKKIGTLAFWKCSQLESVTIPANIDDIAADAFEECQKMKTIVLTGTDGNKPSAKLVAALEGCIETGASVVSRVKSLIGKFGATTVKAIETVGIKS